MKRFSLFLLITLFVTSIYGVYVENAPFPVTQPNGEVLELLITGDEFFRRLHDSEGYTIVQREDGWYTYALYDAILDELIPSEYIAETNRNVSIPIPMEKGLKISPEKYHEIRRAWHEPTGVTASGYRENSILEYISQQENRATTTINSIVICIRFSDHTDMGQTFSTVDGMLNTNTDNNVRDFFTTMSYGKLDLVSNFFPPANGNVLRFYEAPNPRSYYNNNNNTILHALFRDAIEWVNTNWPVPNDLELDYNNDNNVDYVTFICSGTADNNTLLWPHKWQLSGTPTYINGKRVREYNLLLSGASSSYFNSGVFCHEGFHVLGSPDLYHYDYNTNLAAVGAYDLMASNGTKPQSMSAYMKYKYGKWINNIIVAEWDKTYEVYPFYNNDGSDPEKPVIVRVPCSGNNQFYIVEYRKKTGCNYDNQTSYPPAAGPLIYRINSTWSGNAEYNPNAGRHDEVYVFRGGSTPSGNTYTGGTMTNAPFTGSRTFFNGTATSTPRAFTTENVYDTSVDISDIAYDAASDSYTFFYGDGSKFFNIADQSPIILEYFLNSTAIIDIDANVKWTVSVSPSSAEDWLYFSRKVGINDMSFQIATADYNFTGTNRTATVTITGNGISIPISVTQLGITPVFSCETDADLNYENASEEINLTTNLVWSITDIDGDWISIEPLSGTGNETLIVTAPDNTVYFSRTGSFKVNAHDTFSQIVTVTQADLPMLLNFDTDEVVLQDHQDASETITIIANMSWNVVNFPSWLSLSALSGTQGGPFTLTATDNITASPRTGTITIENIEWEQSATLLVTQQAKIVTLSASTDEITLGFTADSNDDFDIIASHNWNIASSVGWLTITPNNGTGNETVNVKATENSSLSPRNATLTITSYYETITVDIIQEGFVSIFSLDLDEININKENNSTETVELSSNRMWTAQKVGTWFNFAPSMGMGDATITITTTSENNTFETRTGTITFTNNLLESVVLTVNQSGKTDCEVLLSANPTEGGTVSGDGLHPYNSEVIVTATPNQHYNFVNWTENGTEVSTSQEYSFTITDNIDLVANFTLKSYEVSVSASPSDGGNVNGDGMYVYNTEATITATPSQHYNFVNWTENGTEVSTTQEYTFLVTGDIELVANFIPNSYEVTVSANPSIGGNVDGGGIFVYDTEITVEAEASDCYNFINWTNENNPVSTNPNYTFYVTEDIELVANFALKTFTVTITANSEEGNVSGDGTFECGTIINLVATPNLGYCFVKWLINGEVVETGTSYSFEITEDVSISVEFELCSYIVTVEAGEGGIVQGGGTYNFGENAEVIATPNDDYIFVNWTNDDGDEVSDENPFIFPVISDITLTANFEPVPIVYYTVTLLVNNDEWGTVAGEGEYEADTEAEVTATPEDNYKFVNWTNEDGDEVSDNNIFIFFVTEDITLTANFEYDEGILKTEISGFTIYPNPAKDILTVISSTKVKATIEIFNGIGSLLQKVEMNDIETKIDVSSLSSGVYILRLTHERGSSVLKFVKE